jgi:hypothetical protein
VPTIIEYEKRLFIVVIQKLQYSASESRIGLDTRDLVLFHAEVVSLLK